MQEFLGHADPRMTSRYAHVVDMAKKNPALFHPGEGGVRVCGFSRTLARSRSKGVYC